METRSRGLLLWGGLAALLLLLSARPYVRYLGPPTPAPCGCQPIAGYPRVR